MGQAFNIGFLSVMLLSSLYSEIDAKWCSPSNSLSSDSLNAVAKLRSLLEFKKNKNGYRAVVRASSVEDVLDSTQTEQLFENACDLADSLGLEGIIEVAYGVRLDSSQAELFGDGFDSYTLASGDCKRRRQFFSIHGRLIWIRDSLRTLPRPPFDGAKGVETNP